MTDNPTQDADARQAELVAAYEEGREAYRDYVRYNDCPYDYRTQPELSDNWCNGWLEADALAHG